MRKDVQDIFRSTNRDKQVLMFSATLSSDIKKLCEKFMNKVSFKKKLWNYFINIEIFILFKLIF